jgi:hypothetical protein
LCRSHERTVLRQRRKDKPMAGGRGTLTRVPLPLLVSAGVPRAGGGTGIAGDVGIQYPSDGARSC